jgi:hypothetical protein
MDRRFTKDERVLVRVCEGNDGPVMLGRAPGTVYKPRRQDWGAWIELDQRSDAAGAHPFPADDSRARHVLAYPVDCDPEPPRMESLP